MVLHMEQPMQYLSISTVHKTMFVKIDEFTLSHLILMEKVFSYYTDPQNIKLVWLQESSISFISIFIDLVDFDI